MDEKFTARILLLEKEKEILNLVKRQMPGTVIVFRRVIMARSRCRIEFFISVDKPNNTSVWKNVKHGGMYIGLYIILICENCEVIDIVSFLLFASLPSTLILQI